jgi:hypothetical protein
VGVEEQAVMRVTRDATCVGCQDRVLRNEVGSGDGAWLWGFSKAVHI